MIHRSIIVLKVFVSMVVSLWSSGKYLMIMAKAAKKIKKYINGSEMEISTFDRQTARGGPEAF
jgi:hypothetical protein